MANWPKWEYQIITVGYNVPDNVNDILDKLGEEGWALCCYREIVIEKCFEFIFKRQKE